MKIFMICPVRNVSDSQRTALKGYIDMLEKQGHEVYYPARDTNQNDKSGGYQICIDNCNGMKDCDWVYVYWDKESQGSLFDLGMAFAMQKPIRIINVEDLRLTTKKSFDNMINFWHIVSLIDWNDIEKSFKKNDKGE